MEGWVKASVVDLRYKMRDILKALRQNEKVEILYHGKVTGTIYPAVKKKKKADIKRHPFYGMYEGRYKHTSVESIMDELRGGRYRAL